MTATEIIQDIFELYVDDTSELSTTEELALLNRIYKRICRQRSWAILKTQASGTISQSGTTYYITLPTDFGFLIDNNQTDGDDSPKVIFVGSSYVPYKVINFSDRRQHRDSDGYAYIDLANNRIVFTGNPTSNGTTYEFDYIKIPADLVAGDSPVFPADFHPIIGYGMAVDGYIIQLFDRARSYQQENQIKYNEGFKDMCLWDSQFYSE